MSTAALTLPQLTRARLLRTRRVLLRILYAPIALFAIVMSAGLVVQLTGQTPEGPYGFAAASTTAWKALSLFGYLGIFWTAGRSVRCVQWLLVGQLTWAIAEALATQDPAAESAGQAVLRQVFNTLLFLLPWLLLAPERRDLLRLRLMPDRVALAVVGVASPFLVWWTIENRGLSIPDIDGSSGAELRFDLVGLTLVFITVGLLAALRPGGTRWLLGVVGVGAAYTGVAALVADSGDVASPGRIGGLALLAGGVALVLRSRCCSSSDRRTGTAGSGDGAHVGCSRSSPNAKKRPPSRSVSGGRGIRTHDESHPS